MNVEELRATLRSKEHLITCQNCREHTASDVHHRDGNHGNNDPLNIVPWCKRCHNEHHGISDNLTELGLLVAEYEDIQKMRIAMGNRIGAYNRLGYDVATSFRFLGELCALEDQVGKAIAGTIKGVPIYEGWLKHVKGISHIMGAKLLSYIGSVDKFPTVSSLWAYAGTAVINGKTQRKQRGQKANWHHELKRLVVYQIPGAFIRMKAGQPLGRRLYEQYKRFYRERDGEIISGMQIERRAKRKVGKVFLACLWARWRELEGLSVCSPYAVEHLGHTHLVTPGDWVT